MNTCAPVFAQVTRSIHPQQFRRCVELYGGEYKVHHFSCWDQFLCMAFGQMTFRESLREVVECLNARPQQLYHMGFRSPIRRSTMADANERRDWRIYETLARGLMAKAQRLYADEPLGVDFPGAAYAFDSSIIDLCLSLHPWAPFQSATAGIKLHTLLALRGGIPSFMAISSANQHDVRALDRVPIEPGALYVLDRGYLDFSRLYRFHQHAAFFVVRTKDNLRFARYRSIPNAHPQVRSDHIGRLARSATRSDYPELLRRICYHDVKEQSLLTFMTNHLLLPAFSVAQVYRRRWSVELFFKWIKQHLCIRRYYGTSANAVKTQVWIAVCVYLLVAILRKQLQVSLSMHSILQILSVTAFEKVPLSELLAGSAPRVDAPQNEKQLLFNIL